MVAAFHTALPALSVAAEAPRRLLGPGLPAALPPQRPRRPARQQKGQGKALSQAGWQALGRGSFLTPALVWRPQDLAGMWGSLQAEVGPHRHASRPHRAQGSKGGAPGWRLLGHRACQG